MLRNGVIAAAAVLALGGMSMATASAQERTSQGAPPAQPRAGANVNAGATASGAPGYAATHRTGSRAGMTARSERRTGMARGERRTAFVGGRERFRGRGAVGVDVGVGYPGYAYDYGYAAGPSYGYAWGSPGYAWGGPSYGYAAVGGCPCAGYGYAAAPVGVGIGVGVGPGWGWY